jgi:4-amino-4-deoxy-L-arabinose transferase-like glycosyltransferase
MSHAVQNEESSAQAYVFWLVLAATSAWKVYVTLKLDVCYDEGYYYYWSLFPQLSYLDHPPLAAWAMWLSGLLFGHSVWTIRLWPLAAGVLLAFVGRDLGTQMFGSRCGDLAGVFLLLGPIFVANGFVMTPDTLYALAWAAGTNCAYRALTSPQKASPWWLAAGICAGFGLLSKYNMVLFFVSLSCLWLFVPEWRRQIFWGVAVAVLIAFSMFSPVIAWNAKNDWLSFRFQLQKGLTANLHPLWQNMFNYLGGLLITVTPLLSILCFPRAALALFGQDRRKVFLASFFWPMIVLFGYSAAKTWVQANWPLMAFFTGVILIAAEWDKLRPWIRHATLAVLIVCDLAVMCYFVLPRQFPLVIAGRQIDPARMKEFYGAGEVAHAVEQTKAEYNASAVIVKTHQLYGSLAFYAPQLQNVLLLPFNVPPRFPWTDNEQWAGKDILLVSIDPWEMKNMPAFNNVRFVKKLEVPVKRDLKKEIFIYLGEGYQPESFR